MLKVFGKVWHVGLIYKLKSVRASGDLLKLINNVLSDRFQQILLNGQTSDWLPQLKHDYPQGSILGQLFFLFTLMTYQII